MAGVRHIVIGIALLASSMARGQQLDAANEAAIRAAADKLAPSVVLIETAGGSDRIGAGPRQIRKGVGPTTGLVVASDGYIVSSAFNFANKPTTITVSIPGRKERFIARVVANDVSRMVTLLKVEATGLIAPEAMPANEVKIGMWAVALGRALDHNTEHSPSISVGIVSALERVWGKMIQTDAKISPVNYGGPLVAMDGRVLGVLVPASPNSDGETAGFEWYDSGIGFAVPLAHIQEKLPKLRTGATLRTGVLGITAKSSDIYSVVPTIGHVSPDSAASKAGVKPGDVIVAIDGHPVANQAQVKHRLGPKYEGDVISLRVKRGSEEVAFDKVTLLGAASVIASPFAGILPVRDDPELGVEARFVYPESGIAKAGLAEGDRIMKVGLASARSLRAFSGRDQLREWLDSVPAGSDVKVEVKKKDGATATLAFKLDRMPDSVPDVLPIESSHKKALAPRKQAPLEGGPAVPGLPKMPGQPKDKSEPKPKPESKAEEKAAPPKKAETGLLHRPSPSRDREYWMYVPENYDPNIAHGLVIWLHAPGQGGKDGADVAAIWKTACEQQHLIVVGPKSNHESGWLASEAEFVQETAREVIGQYTIDRQRVVAHGLGIGGQMAYYLAFNARDLIRGAAVTGAVLASPPKDAVAGQRLSFFIVAGNKDPLVKDIAAAKPLLEDKRYPVAYREVADMGKEYLDRKTFDELIRWIDSLDRL